MFARRLVSLHAAQLPVQKTLATNSRVSISSKRIETKGLQLLHSGHLRKTGGYPLFALCEISARRHFLALCLQSPLSLLFFFNHLRTLSFSVSHLSPIPPAPSALFPKKRGYPLWSNQSHSLAPSPLCHSPALSVAEGSPVACSWFPLRGEGALAPLPRTHKRHRRRRPQGAPAMLQFAGGGGQHCGQQLLGFVEGKGNAEEIGAAGVGVFFVAGGFSGGEACEHIPGRVLREQFLLRGILAGNLHYVALRAAANFEEDSGGFFRLERPRWIVFGEGNQQLLDLFALGGEGVPPIAVAVVDHGAAAKNLLHPRRIFSRDAYDHVHQFVQAEGLLDTRAHAHEPGVFFGVAEGDLFGEWHGILVCGLGRRRPCSGRLLSRPPFPNRQPSLDSFSRTLSLSAFPSTALPVNASFAAFTTPPICFIDVAPVSAMALAIAASLCASLAPGGRYASRNFNSAFSLSTRSWRLPFANWSIDSLRCFTSVCSNWIDSVSSSGRIFSTSFNCRAALAMRSTLSRISSFTFIAATISFFNCSERLIFATLFMHYSRSHSLTSPF